MCVGGLMQIRDQRAERPAEAEAKAPAAEMGDGHAVEEGADATGEQRIASERCFGVRPALVGRGRPHSRVSHSRYSRLVQVRRQHNKHAVTYVNAMPLCRAERHTRVSQSAAPLRSILVGEGERAATQVQRRAD